MSATESFDFNDERRLEISQNVRENIISEMTKKGLPENKEDRAFLLSALDGMDRSVFSKARIKTDSAANKNNQETANIVSQLLSRITPKQILANMETGGQRGPVTLDAEFSVVPVEGEMDIGSHNTNFDEFTQRMENAQ